MLFGAKGLDNHTLSLLNKCKLYFFKLYFFFAKIHSLTEWADFHGIAKLYSVITVHRPCLTFKWLLHGLRFVQFCRLLGILKNAFTTHPSLLSHLTFINNSNFCLNLGGGGNNHPEWKFQPELLNLRKTLTS